MNNNDVAKSIFNDLDNHIVKLKELFGNDWKSDIGEPIVEYIKIMKRKYLYAKQEMRNDEK